MVIWKLHLVKQHDQQLCLVVMLPLSIFEQLNQQWYSVVDFVTCVRTVELREAGYPNRDSACSLIVIYDLRHERSNLSGKVLRPEFEYYTL